MWITNKIKVNDYVGGRQTFDLITRLTDDQMDMTDIPRVIA